MSDTPGYELVMPFLPVTSRGGPFPDDAYTAGYEMGMLHAVLNLYPASTVERTLRTENQEQADLLAMRHGWRPTFRQLDDVWVAAQFNRSAAEDYEP